MPVCFSLYRIGKQEPESLVAVDNAICAELGVVPDDRAYYMGWYDCIGLRLACGFGYDKIRKDFQKDLEKDPENGYLITWLKILDILERDYTVNSWRECKSFPVEEESASSQAN